jgi:hypothetical protein
MIVKIINIKKSGIMPSNLKKKYLQKTQPVIKDWFFSKQAVVHESLSSLSGSVPDP